MKYRIGIDVGGTFTDAVALNNDDFELVGYVKVPTTHSDKSGVAAGIIQALNELMQKCVIRPEDVTFIAHGTTQATNALLEGDVAPVGIITFASGLEGRKARADTSFGNIELAPGKMLRTENLTIDPSKAPDQLPEKLDTTIGELKEAGVEATVSAEAFSVDNPEHEVLGVERSEIMGLPGTATNDVSKLYGLKVRTRTAVVNASIMPTMLNTANMTARSIKEASIVAPLMVMRCDGGVMSIEEVRRRPILTILSGPAAGVAGALMYERLSDGLFFEVGGTSTDISCVRDGQVMVKYAEVGGHKTYLTSLDVRTVGIGGGSMVEVDASGKAVGVGPRSAHIAGLGYDVFEDPIEEPELDTVRPLEGDPSYAVVRGSNGSIIALTLSGAANIAGYVKQEDYAAGNAEAARVAWQPLADAMNCSVEDAANQVLELACEKVWPVGQQLLKDYKLDDDLVELVGGGGGSASVVPKLGELKGHKWHLGKNAAVISPIGVALALVRDTVERTVIDPTQEDILAIRREAEEHALRSGAAEGTIEVTVDVDPQRNLVSAVATGATELRSKDRGQKPLSPDELAEICEDSTGASSVGFDERAKSDGLHVYQGEQGTRRFFGLLPGRVTRPVRVIDDFGVIRFQRRDAIVRQSRIAKWKQDVKILIDKNTIYDDGGASIPNLHLICGQSIVDLSGMQNVSQILSIGEVELAKYADSADIALIVSSRVE